LIDYFNFAESKSELKDRGITSSKAVMSTVTAVDLTERKGSTSERAYEADALVPETEEGRGDRRNVHGELHPSDEP
jgi:hypothetical protein